MELDSFLDLFPRISDRRVLESFVSLIDRNIDRKII